MEDKDFYAMSAVAFGENHPQKEVTRLKLNSCASKSEVLKESLRQKERGAENSILSPVKQKRCLDATVLSQYCQTAAEAAFAE